MGASFPRAAQYGVPPVTASILCVTLFEPLPALLEA